MATDTKAPALPRLIVVDVQDTHAQRVSRGPELNGRTVGGHREQTQVVHEDGHGRMRVDDTLQKHCLERQLACDERTMGQPLAVSESADVDHELAVCDGHRHGCDRVTRAATISGLASAN
jgi:hypothetical protein